MEWFKTLKDYSKLQENLKGTESYREYLSILPVY